MFHLYLWPFLAFTNQDKPEAHQTEEWAQYQEEETQTQFSKNSLQRHTVGTSLVGISLSLEKPLKPLDRDGYYRGLPLAQETHPTTAILFSF